MMKDLNDDLKPADEGSPEALAILQLLWKLQSWLTAETIAALTAMPIRSVALALIGLHDRGRIELGMDRISWRIAADKPIKARNRRHEP